MDGGDEIVQGPVGQLPWGGNVALISKLGLVLLGCGQVVV